MRGELTTSTTSTTTNENVLRMLQNARLINTFFEVETPSLGAANAVTTILGNSVAVKAAMLVREICFGEGGFVLNVLLFWSKGKIGILMFLI